MIAHAMVDDYLQDMDYSELIGFNINETPHYDKPMRNPAISQSCSPTNESVSTRKIHIVIFPNHQKMVILCFFDMSTSVVNEANVSTKRKTYVHKHRHESCIYTKVMQITMNKSFLSILLVFAIAPSRRVFAFVPTQRSSSLSHGLSMGIMDDLKLIFSEEGKKNKAAYVARKRAEQEAAQREILERRRNPEKMQDYQQKVDTKRAKLQEEKEVWGFQGKVEKGFDPITEWERLKNEGKITVGSQMERDPMSSRLGSEGLVDVRTDELLPYIDQGYVDESADVMGNFMKLFGGKKGKDEIEEKKN